MQKKMFHSAVAKYEWLNFISKLCFYVERPVFCQISFHSIIHYIAILIYSPPFSPRLN